MPLLLCSHISSTFLKTDWKNIYQSAATPAIAKLKWINSIGNHDIPHDGAPTCFISYVIFNIFFCHRKFSCFLLGAVWTLCFKYVHYSPTLPFAAMTPTCWDNWKQLFWSSSSDSLFPPQFLCHSRLHMPRMTRTGSFLSVITHMWALRTSSLYFLP